MQVGSDLSEGLDAQGHLIELIPDESFRGEILLHSHNANNEQLFFGDTVNYPEWADTYEFSICMTKFGNASRDLWEQCRMFDGLNDLLKERSCCIRILEGYVGKQ